VLLLRLFVHGESILRNSGPSWVGKGAAMPFSSKAQEIHDHIVSSGKADYWIGAARSIVQQEASISLENATPATFLFLETNSKPSFRAR
jgi:hypothetical protein